MNKKHRRLITSLLLIVFSLTFAPTPIHAAESLYFIHSDHLGSTSLTTNDQGEVISNQVYYPYGSTRSRHPELDSGSQAIERQYTGQVSDQDDTGLYYYNARYYDPLVAKFTQADTVNDQQNRYAYVSNNPIVYSDPTGHCKGIGCWFENLWNNIKQDYQQSNAIQAKVSNEILTNPTIRQGNLAIGYTGIAIWFPIAASAGTFGIRGGIIVTTIIDAVDCAMDPELCIIPGPAGAINRVDNTIDDGFRQTDNITQTLDNAPMGDNFVPPASSAKRQWRLEKQRKLRDEYGLDEFLVRDPDTDWVLGEPTTVNYRQAIEESGHNIIEDSSVIAEVQAVNKSLGHSNDINALKRGNDIHFPSSFNDTPPTTIEHEIVHILQNERNITDIRRMEFEAYMVNYDLFPWGDDLFDQTIFQNIEAHIARSKIAY